MSDISQGCDWPSHDAGSARDAQLSSGSVYCLTRVYHAHITRILSSIALRLKLFASKIHGKRTRENGLWHSVQAHVNESIAINIHILTKIGWP